MGVHTPVFVLAVQFLCFSPTYATRAVHSAVSACAPASVDATGSHANALFDRVWHVVKFGICTHRFSLAVFRRSASVSLPPACVRSRRHSRLFLIFLKRAWHTGRSSRIICMITGCTVIMGVGEKNTLTQPRFINYYERVFFLHFFQDFIYKFFLSGYNILGGWATALVVKYFKCTR